MDLIHRWTREVVLAAEPSSAARARDFVSVHLLEHGLLSLVDDVCLVASELATNAMVHARTPFTLPLRQDGVSVTLSLQDGSPSVPLRVDRSAMDLGGRGMVIVDVLSAAWGVDTGPRRGKSVWAAFATGAQAVPAW